MQADMQFKVLVSNTMSKIEQVCRAHHPHVAYQTSTQQAIDINVPHLYRQMSRHRHKYYCKRPASLIAIQAGQQNNRWLYLPNPRRVVHPGSDSSMPGEQEGMTSNGNIVTVPGHRFGSWKRRPMQSSGPLDAEKPPLLVRRGGCPDQAVTFEQSCFCTYFSERD